MTLIRIFLITIFLSVASLAQAQEGFSLSLLAGMNASQIAGDALSGYNKIGLNAGIKTGYIIGNKWDANLEFLFSQKGSQPRWSDFNIAGRRTTLNYAEIPIYVTFHDWWQEENQYYKVGLHAGMSYARLISGSAGDGTISDDLDNFKNFDVAFLFGAHYSFSKKWRLTMRYTNSVVRIYKGDELTNDGLINYLWTFRMEYKI